MYGGRHTVALRPREGYNTPMETMNKRTNIYLTGFMGSGKTTVGRCLSGLLGLPFTDLDALIEEHRMLHCDTIGLGMIPQEYRGSASGLQAFLKDIAPIASEIKAAGLQFAYHNHNVEFEKWDGVLPMDVLIGETDPETFHFILDTYWLQMGGVSPAAYIRKVKDRMKVCHFKDFAVENWTPTIAEIGVGNIDFKECFRACEDANVQYIVIEQDTCPRDPFDCLANSFRNLKAIAADH